MTVFEGEKGGAQRISVNHGGGSLVSASISIACRLAGSLQMFSCPKDLPAGLLRELLEVEN